MGDVIDGDKYEQLSAQVFDDIEAAQFLDSMSYDKFHGLVYKSYGELNGAITDGNYDTDKLLDQIKEQVIAEVEEDYADKAQTLLIPERLTQEAVKSPKRSILRMEFSTGSTEITSNCLTKL